MDRTDNSRLILFTNIDGMWFDGMLLHANALLLEETWTEDPDLDFRSHSCRMRGFGPDSRWPVFERRIPSIEYKLEHRAADDARPLSGRLAPLLKGGSIKLLGLPEPVLFDLHDPEMELDVRTFTDATDTAFAAMWSTLNRNTQDVYWSEAGMPRLTYGFSPRVEARIRAANPAPKPESAKSGDVVERHRDCGGLVKLRGDVFSCFDCGAVCTTQDTETAKW